MSGAPDKRLVIGLGAVAAIGIGVLAALAVGRGDSGPAEAPPAAEGGLQIEVGDNGRSAIDPAKPLRCFVKGEFVGMETLARCAERNGTSAQALDVGLDETGAVAATTEGTLAPLPDMEVADVTAPAPVRLPGLPDMGPLGPGAGGAGGSQAAWSACMKHGAQGWSVVSQSAPLSVCVNLLFDGRCEQPGNAQYGRWGDQTVRLVPGKVEIAPDGRTFTTLVEQTGDCMVPAI